MDKNTLDRLRQLAGNAPALQYVADQSRKNMYEIRNSLMESNRTLTESEGWKVTMRTLRDVSDKVYDYLSSQGFKYDDIGWANEELIVTTSSKNEARAIARAIFSRFKDPTANAKPEIMQISEQSLEESKPDFADIDGDGDEKESMKKAAKDKEKADEASNTEAQTMREWANSIYKQYDDRGHYQEQPDGETVDLSLRRYLDADAMPVKIEEDHTEESMLREYKNFKGKK